MRLAILAAATLLSVGAATVPAEAAGQPGWHHGWHHHGWHGRRCGWRHGHRHCW